MKGNIKSLALFVLAITTSMICHSSGAGFGNDIDQNTNNFTQTRNGYYENRLHIACETDMQDRLQMNQSLMLQMIVNPLAQAAVAQAVLVAITWNNIQTVLTTYNVVYQAYTALLFLTDLFKVCMLQSYLDSAMHFEKMIKQLINGAKKEVVTQEYFNETYNSPFLAMASLHTNKDLDQNTFNDPAIQAKWNGAKKVMQFPVAKELTKRAILLENAKESKNTVSDGEEKYEAIDGGGTKDFKETYEQRIKKEKTELDNFIQKKQLDQSLVDTYIDSLRFASEKLQDQAKKIKANGLKIKDRGAFDEIMYNSCTLLSATTQSN
ncbi:MAG: hypothetical protein LBP31_00065 [Holosporales bacterium]|jgi:hypothetical protein|nr:hypothetical protein [Holosporales bacterium]